MEIKVERIHILDKSGPTKAFCDVSFDDEFMVKGLRVVEGKEGMFVAMPAEQMKDGKWFEVFFPLSSLGRRKLSDVVLEEYKKHKGGKK